MRNYDTVIFDLDGTLLDTLTDLTAAVNYALAEMDMPIRTLAEIRTFVGNGVGQLITSAVPPGYKNEERDMVLNRFSEYYQHHCMDQTKPYPGIIPLLQNLKSRGYALAIVSNKPDSAVKELHELFFKEYVKIALGERAGVSRKPQPDMVWAALKELGAARERAVYVGDSQVDVATARNADMTCISVLWGFRDQAALLASGANMFANTPEEMMEML